MIDPQLLRQDPHAVAASLAKTRAFNFDASHFVALDEKRKALQVATQALQNQRNQKSKAIGIAKAQGLDIDPLRLEMQQVGEDLESRKLELDEVLAAIDAMCMSLPNIPHASVPIGKDERDNLELRRVGEIPHFDFEVRSHDVLGEAIGQMDFALAAKITGSRFVVLRTQLAKLHRALIQFMLDVHTESNAYQEIYVPYIVNSDSLFGTGQLPKFEQDLFKLEGESGYYLISTAEIPVTNTVRDTLIDASMLPIRYVCHTPCFRSEAGSYGRDTKGMIRQHQFEKVELVWVTTPESSYDALEALTGHAESILQRLGLSYRVMTLCSGDMGASAAKTYDIEVWLPSQNTYREISSCSNMEAFQARRLKARYRPEGQKDSVPVHTLNGSGLAVGRTLVAIMENYQDAQGRIHIPKALQPYMGNITLIG